MCDIKFVMIEEIKCVCVCASAFRSHISILLIACTRIGIHTERESIYACSNTLQTQFPVFNCFKHACT